MQGFTVFLASKTEEENQILRRKLESLIQEFKNLRFIGLHPQGLALSAHEKMSVVVINVPEWTNNDTSYARSLRSAGYNGPILIMAKPTASKALRTIRAMTGVVFLQKPFDAKDLVGIVRKMLNARAVSQQVHKRFSTDESAEVEFYGRNDRYLSRVGNLSKGGAYLEFMTPTPIRAGDMVRVRVELKDVSRVYTVPARVVWINRASGGTGAGIEFVGQPDVKKTIYGAY